MQIPPWSEPTQSLYIMVENAGISNLFMSNQFQANVYIVI